MNLEGTYECAALNSKLVVTSANDQNGQASGQFVLDGINIPVQIHYHFKDNVGPETNLWFAGNDDNPNEYVGGAGSTLNNSYQSINLGGAYPTENSVRCFQGEYKRV